MTPADTAAENVDRPVPEISFVIPARNEELLLRNTLHSIRTAAGALNLMHEIVVVDDASTDRTAEIAREEGTQLVSVELHNIGAVRNAGAKVASGQLLIFLDADTQISANTLAAIQQAIAEGALGGGAHVEFEGVTWFQKALIRIFLFFWQGVCGWAAGCCLFVKRSVFEEIGGFDTAYYAAEERYLSEAIQSRGRFRIVTSPVLTSGRKLRLYSTCELIGLALKTLLRKGTRLTSRDGLEFFYDAPRETSPPR